MFRKSLSAKGPDIVKRILCKGNKPFPVLFFVSAGRSGLLHLNCDKIVLLHDFTAAMNYQITVISQPFLGRLSSLKLLLLYIDMAIHIHAITLRLEMSAAATYRRYRHPVLQYPMH